jgi:hypothetical protein
MARNLTTGLQRGLQRRLRPGLGGGDLFTIAALDLNFARYKNLDPRITHTRASSATFVDSSGVLRSAVTNLKTFSDAILVANAYGATNSTLTTASIANPFGGTTASLFTLNVGANTGNNTDGFNFGSGVTLTNLTQHTQSLFVKPSGATILRLRSNTTGLTVDFTLTGNGTAPSPSADLQAAFIVPLANGWYRVSWLFTTTTSPAGNRSDAWTIKTNVADGTNGLYVVGAQLEQASTVGEYVPTTSVINSAPRFDHNPTTGESLGLLVEEARTNLLLRSEEFDATWTPNALQAFGSGSIANAIASSSGSITADLITENTANSEHNVSQTITVTVNTVYTLSCFAKKGTRSILAMSPTSPGVANYYTLFNLDTGAIVYNETGNTSTITALANGWYRCVTTRTTGAAQVLSNNKIGIANNALSTTYTGDGTSGIYIWGAQLEAGAFSTSYIPTTSATATRAADVASITGANFSSWYNQTEGTIEADFVCGFQGSSVQSTSSYGIWGITNPSVGSFNGYGSRLVGNSNASDNINSLSRYAPASQNNQVNIGLSAFLNYGQTYKTVFAWNSSVIAGTSAGATVQTNTNSAFANNSGVTQLLIGNQNVGGSGPYQLNGTIKRLTYWPTCLSNTTLQQITQP